MFWIPICQTVGDMKIWCFCEQNKIGKIQMDMVEGSLLPSMGHKSVENSDLLM